MRSTTAVLLIAATLLAIATSTPASANSFIEWRAEVADAKRESKLDSKPMLVKVSTSWCMYCVKMQLETFDDVAVVKQVEECFVPLAIDGDEHRQLIERLGIDTFPTTLVVSPKMKVLKKIVGFRSAGQLQTELLGVCKEEKPKPKTLKPRKSVFGKRDPVAMSITGFSLNGNPKFTTVYEGYKLAFHNEANMNEFLRNSRRYWPVADGVCVVSALDGGSIKHGRVEHSLEYQGRNWLFATPEHRVQFQAKPDAYLARLRDLAKSKRNKDNAANSISLTR